MRRRFDTGAAAAVARELLAEDPDNLTAVWRHSILQLLDDYEGARRRDERAPELFSPEPPSTGNNRVDSALAALTEYLARRDDWEAPDWVTDPARYAEPWWFVAGLRSLEATAVQESPLSFRKRGIFITARALSRA